MMRGIIRRSDARGQSTLELAILLVVIVAAFIALQRYVKYAASGRLKSSADSISQTMFNPHEGRTKLVVSRESTDRVFMKPGVGTTKADWEADATKVGRMDSVTAAGKDITRRCDTVCKDGDAGCTVDAGCI